MAKIKDEDFIAKKFNHLTVLSRGPYYVSPSGHRQSQWWCQCDCSEKNIILVRQSNLISGNTKSCGCQNQESRIKNLKKAHIKNALDLTGQIFGELTALHPTEKRNNNSVVWECRCSCGKIHYVSAHDLKHHRIESCGHSFDSKGVRKIKKILTENNIPFETEKVFKECNYEDTLQHPRFDFFINNEFLLEYDGIQHFKECDQNFFRDTLEQRQTKDAFKNAWCKEHGYVLKRIPYTEIDNITLSSIMGDNFLI